MAFGILLFLDFKSREEMEMYLFVSGRIPIANSYNKRLSCIRMCLNVKGVSDSFRYSGGKVMQLWL